MSILAGMNPRIESLIHHLELEPHPEGGYFRETYRSDEILHSPDVSGSRSMSTAIYFLLTKGNFSAFHRIASDEVWHFYEGTPCIVHVLHHFGGYSRICLGASATEADWTYQAVVKAGDWFASESSGDYSLVGCTVAPGFDFQDFEMAERERLCMAFPEYTDLITRLTRQS